MTQTVGPTLLYEFQSRVLLYWPITSPPIILVIPLWGRAFVFNVPLFLQPHWCFFLTLFLMAVLSVYLTLLSTPCTLFVFIGALLSLPQSDSLLLYYLTYCSNEYDEQLKGIFRYDPTEIPSTLFSVGWAQTQPNYTLWNTNIKTYCDFKF